MLCKNLVHFSYGIVKEQATSENIVQDTFLHIWENRNKLDENKGLKSYLFLAYHRMDIRVYKHFFTSYGKFSLLLELINFYNQKKQRKPTYQKYINQSKSYLKESFDNWFPFFPSIGLSWQYEL